jgi:hypothetical protein
MLGDAGFTTRGSTTQSTNFSATHNTYNNKILKGKLFSNKMWGWVGVYTLQTRLTYAKWVGGGLASSCSRQVPDFRRSRSHCAVISSKTRRTLQCDIHPDELIAADDDMAVDIPADI